MALQLYMLMNIKVLSTTVELDMGTAMLGRSLYVTTRLEANHDPAQKDVIIIFTINPLPTNDTCMHH